MVSHMNQSTLFQNPFSLDYTAASDSDYTGTPSQFSNSAGFPMDEDDSTRRVCSLGHPLGQPVSIPASNGLRYSAQQPAMQDVPFAASPSLLMSPADSCSDNFSQASGSVYSHPAALQYERMPDLRTRVPTLQPPTGISPAMQSSCTAVASPGVIGRGDDYSSAFNLGRNSFPPLTGLNGMTRFSQYTSTPRVLDNPVDRSQNMTFGHAGNMLLEPAQRVPHSLSDTPPFYETNVLHSVVTGSHTINPEIKAKIQKGFFLIDGKWTCYRRNYFTVSCSFNLRPWSANSALFIKFPDQGTERILSFAMSISAIVNAQHGETRELVQYTPKRDKETERKPPQVTMQPSQPPPLALSHGPAAPSNHHLGYGLTPHSTGMTMDYSSSYPGAPQPSHPPTHFTFERIQFQKATANNGKRRAQQQYYNLVVELHAEIASGGDGTQWVKIARKLSHPVVVRGRSPGHYKDGRRNNSANMGPDGGSGFSGDGGRGPFLPPGIPQNTRTHLALMCDSPQGGSSHYGRTDYRQMASRRDQSPLSGSPLISSSSSSGLDLTTMSMDPIDTMKHTSSLDSYQDPSFAVTTPDYRKAEAPITYRNQLPPFEYGSAARENGDSGNGFSDTFDPMMPVIHNDQDDPSHFARQTPRISSYHHHQPTTSGYDPIFPSRPTDSSLYARFDPIQNPQSLCT